MNALAGHGPRSGAGRTLLVLLPGAGMRAVDFSLHGFDAAARVRAGTIDVVAVDTTIDRYVDADFAARLHDEQVAPLVAATDALPWVAGISAGALGALRYAEHHPTQGLLLLSPFIGSRGLIAEVETAGGLAAWVPGANDEQTIERRLLQRLKAYRAEDPRWPSIFLGYGSGDRFVAAHRLLAALLPDERVIAIPGGHDWPTWELLWGRLLEAAQFGSAPAGVATGQPS